MIHHVQKPGGVDGRQNSLRSRFLPMILLVAIVSGCSTYVVKIPQLAIETPKGRCETKTVWSLYWGIKDVPSPILDPKECYGQGMGEVRVKSNLLFDLVSVLTLGFASPKRVEWYCADPDAAEGDFPIFEMVCDTMFQRKCDTIHVDSIVCCDKISIRCDSILCDTAVASTAGGE